MTKIGNVNPDPHVEATSLAGIDAKLAQVIESLNTLVGRLAPRQPDLADRAKDEIREFLALRTHREALRNPKHVAEKGV